MAKTRTGPGKRVLLGAAAVLVVSALWPDLAAAKRPCRSPASDPGCNPPTALGNRTTRPLPAGSQARRPAS